MTTQEILQAAQTARMPLALADADTKNAALEAMAVALIAAKDAILDANAKDLAAARGRVSDVMLDRLALTPSRLTDMAKGMREVAALPDPVGAVLRRIVRPNGLVIEKTAVPMGVIAIIYESRPNVTSDAAALAVKAGSACILRCGRDAWASCHAIVEALRAGLRKAHLPETAVSLIEDTSHASANELMTADGLVDLLIPRGGAGLIRACVENATVPCIQTGTGICHVYVDAAADLEMAVNIVENAKTSRPSVCNAEEALLVHRDVAAQFLPMLKQRLVDDRTAAGLTPVFHQSEENIMLLADGRLLWRAMSNVLSNAVKYALPGTRLYVDVSATQDKAIISFKNISGAQLNISAEELMERFVRGDSSRNTEGSGLGLNIAKSLMELQKGQLQLLVDGDLFKVTLVFPRAK